MIEENTLTRLKNNWPFADNLACFVECRVYDPASGAEWYLIACNPENDDTFAAIVAAQGVELETISMVDLVAAAQASGRELMVDEYWQRTKAMQVWGRLKRTRRQGHDIQAG